MPRPFLGNHPHLLKHKLKSRWFLVWRVFVALQQGLDHRAQPGPDIILILPVDAEIAP